MADLPKIDRPQRRIPQPGELDGITMVGRGLGQAGARMSPDGLTARAPQIDVRGFIDEARGMAQVGQAVQNIGGATMQLAVEQARAVADRQARDARRALGAVETEMSAALAQEPDEEKWPDILNSQIERARSVVNDTPMMADAKLAANDFLANWETQQRHNVTMLQTRRSFDRARESLQADVTEAVDRRDFGAARAALDTRQARLYLGEDRVAAELGQIGRAEEAFAEKAAYDMHFAAATNDPAGWKEQNAKPWPGREALWARVKNAADSREREISADSTDKALDMIVGGQITVPAEVDALDLPGLTPTLREKVKQSLESWDAKRSDEEKRTNGEANWLKMWREARAWKGGDSDKAAEEYWDMMSRTRYGVPDDAQGQITELLSAKMGLNRPPKPSTETEKAADRVLETYWKDGTFNGGKPMRRLNPQTIQMEDDPAAVRNAAGPEGAVRQKVRQYLETHPDTKPEEVPRIINEMLPDGMRSSVLRGLQDSLKFGGVSVPKSGDLGEAVKLTVFGGPNDPVDNGKSAFGGKTGAGGREGVAIPAKILKHVYGGTKADWERAKVEVKFPNGGTEILPIADLGTAEWVWDRDNGPVIDLTEGAVEQLGGRVIYGRNGTLKGVSGLKGLSFRLLPLDDQGAPFDQ